MTNLVMYDAITVPNIPKSAQYIAGYVGGSWPTYHTLVTYWPHAKVLSIAPFASENAECLDVEPYDATNSQVVPWIKRQLENKVYRPCIYSSADNMNTVYDEIQAAGIPRSSVRLWSAHYGNGSHICGPSSCGLVRVACDGTQWTDNALGRSLDESTLLPNFFATATPPTPTTTSAIPVWETTIMNVLPTVAKGNTNKAVVKRIQALIMANYDPKLAVDGSFGTNTQNAVKSVQKSHKLPEDGIVGPKTWSVLVTGA